MPCSSADTNILNMLSLLILHKPTVQYIVSEIRNVTITTWKKHASSHWNQLNSLK